MNFLENIRNERKIKGDTYKITPSSVTYCPSVPNSISNECHEAGLLLNGQICRLSNLHNHEY